MRYSKLAAPGLILATFFASPAAFDARALGGAISSPPTHLYWHDANKNILRAKLDGTGVETVVQSPEFISRFVVDSNADRIYWTADRHLFRADLDGANMASIFTFPTHRTGGDITIDPIRRNLFFTDEKNKQLYRANLDGSNATVIVDGAAAGFSFYGVQVDPEGQKVYWSAQRQLRRANLDGTGDETIVTAPGSIGHFDIDFMHGLVYWGRATAVENQGGVYRANLDGTSQQIILSGGLWGIGGLALDVAADRMYFADHSTAGGNGYVGTIQTARLDGSDRRVVLNLGPNTLPEGLTLDPKLVPEPTTASLVLAAVFIWLAPRRRC